MDTHEVDRTDTEAALHRLHAIEAPHLIDTTRQQVAEGANVAATEAGYDCAGGVNGRHDFRFVDDPAVQGINIETLTCLLCGETCTLSPDAP